MKICFHTNWEINSKYVGGTERFLICICKELELLGHEPFIVCSSLNEESNIEGIKVLGRIPLKIKKVFEKYSYFSSAFIKTEIIGEKYSVDSLKRLSEYTQYQLSDIDADVFNLNSFISGSFINPASNYVITNHENELEYDHYWGQGFFDFMSQLVKDRKTELHNYKALMTPSKYYANEFSKKLRLKVSGINLGISLYDFRIPLVDDLLRKKYFENSSGTIILFPSRFQTKQKGHDVAVKACQILKENNINFKMIFTGLRKSTEKYLPDFFRLAEDYNVRDKVEVTTFADIQTAYASCDIVISPERYCSYGLSISEALSLGLPTILSDIPTYKEIADGFKHASFFENGSHVDLANKLMNLISTGTNRDRKEAIRFRTKFDLRECAKRYIEVYNSL